MRDLIPIDNQSMIIETNHRHVHSPNKLPINLSRIKLDRGNAKLTLVIHVDKHFLLFSFFSGVLLLRLCPFSFIHRPETFFFFRLFLVNSDQGA